MLSNTQMREAYDIQLILVSFSADVHFVWWNSSHVVVEFAVRLSENFRLVFWRQQIQYGWSYVFGHARAAFPGNDFWI